MVYGQNKSCAVRIFAVGLPVRHVAVAALNTACSSTSPPRTACVYITTHAYATARRYCSPATCHSAPLPSTACRYFRDTDNVSFMHRCLPDHVMRHG